VAGSSEPVDFSNGDIVLSWLNDFGAIPGTGDSLDLSYDPLLFMGTANDSNYKDYPGTLDQWFYILYHGEGTTLTDLLDVEKLKMSSQTAFREVWVDFVQDFLQPPASDIEVEGSISAITQQVVARPISVRVGVYGYRHSRCFSLTSENQLAKGSVIYRCNGHPPPSR
jgi:hypothetical protein